MCGIIAYIGPQDAVSILIEGLKKLEYRGYDSAGIAVVDEGQIKLRRVKGKISSLEESLRKDPLKGSYGLAHTRWATHGRPSEENAHPHRDCKGSLVVVHNGIIENYLSLKEKLKREGHEFKTETDTEVIAHLIEKHFRSSLEEATAQALKELEGAFAIAVASILDEGKIVAAKVGPPLVVGIGEGEFFLSSDINPLLSHTRRVVFLEDREMVVVRPGDLRFRNFEGKPLEKKEENISWTPLMIEKRGFKHFMLKEIFEQPQVVRDTLQGRISLEKGKICLDEIGFPCEVLKKIQRIVIVACGTSYHAGLVGRYLIENLSRIPVEIEFASEYRYRDHLCEKDKMIIVVSQSGETADSLGALRVAKENDTLSLAITNVVNSALARESHGVLYTHAGPEIGVAATKTFSAQLTALALLALFLANLRNEIESPKVLELIQDLQRIPYKMEKILSASKSIEELALGFVSFSHFLYLGRWISYPVALEGALKLKEISYIHAEGYPGGEMKHGPIALIDEKMPTMVIIPRDRVYEKMLNNIAEIKSRVGYIVAVAYEEDEEIKERVDKVIRVPSSNPLFSPFLTVLPLQLFAYHIASHKGVDIDQPRNLAKSVTVE